MGFQLLPAIDLAAGRIARLQGGVRLYPGDPLELARRYVDEGAHWLHVVDLDAALTGRPANLPILRLILALPVRVQAGGGLTPEAVDRVLAEGAARAVLGAGALSEPSEVEDAVRAHGDRVGVAVDVRAGMIAPRGRAGEGPAVAEVVPVLARIRPSFVVYTDVDRDGAALGPDLRGLSAIAAGTRVPVIASGGIRSIGDLRDVAATPGVTGAIVGRALLEGAFGLREALAAMA